MWTPHDLLSIQILRKLQQFCWEIIGLNYHSYTVLHATMVKIIGLKYPQRCKLAFLYTRNNATMALHPYGLQYCRLFCRSSKQWIHMNSWPHAVSSHLCRSNSFWAICFLSPVCPDLRNRGGQSAIWAMPKYTQFFLWWGPHWGFP